jgi:hypothetical protein
VHANALVPEIKPTSRTAVNFIAASIYLGFTTGNLNYRIEMPHIVSSATDAWHYTPLSLVGLLGLADLNTIAERTALNGTSGWLDVLILCPGLHRQHKATQLNDGEFPACAAMTTGYVFRIENPATVFYLQSVGETGKLTSISVTETDARFPKGAYLVHLAAGSSVAALAFLVSLRDWWAVSYLLILVSVRFINTALIRAQARVDWHGQSEPGQLGDLFILLSYDRWVRIRGEVDDLKAVTSGRWLRRPTAFEEVMSGCATLLAYAAPVLAANATLKGQVIIAILLVGDFAALATANYLTTALRMKGKTLRIQGPRRSYKRRSILASELIAESGRSDWAVAMGLIPGESHVRSPITM